MLWAVLRVASMFRQSRTQAHFRLRFTRAESWPKFERERSFSSVKQDTYDFGSEPKCIRHISVISQPESPLARCLKVFGTNYQPEFTLALYSVSQPEVAMFIRTYTNVSALSARSHQLYRNTNVFGLKRLFSSASKVQQLGVNTQRRSRSQANGRSNLRFSRRSKIAEIGTRILYSSVFSYPVWVCCVRRNSQFISARLRDVHHDVTRPRPALPALAQTQPSPCPRLRLCCLVVFLWGVSQESDSSIAVEFRERGPESEQNLDGTITRNGSCHLALL